MDYLVGKGNTKQVTEVEELNFINSRNQKIIAFMISIFDKIAKKCFFMLNFVIIQRLSTKYSLVIMIEIPNNHNTTINRIKRFNK